MLANKIATYNQDDDVNSSSSSSSSSTSEWLFEATICTKKMAFPGPLLRTLLFPNIHQYEGLPKTDNRLGTPQLDDVLLGNRNFRPTILYPWWCFHTYQGFRTIPGTIPKNDTSLYHFWLLKNCCAHLGPGSDWCMVRIFFQLSAELHNQIPSLPGPKNTTLISTSPN